jgi:cytoskeletal protein CcmA (bactofilin family)
MSDPQGQLSGLRLEEPPLNQSSTPTGECADFLPDTLQYFEAWLEPGKNLPARVNVADAREPGEFSFEGTLRVDGFCAGFFRSLTGTLIISDSGEVEADIIVATAIIDGCVRGNIYATESVVLGNRARVFGNVESPALSIRPGATFEGHCHLPSPYQAKDEDYGGTRSGGPTFSIPSSTDSQIAKEEIGEEEAEPLALVAG